MNGYLPIRLGNSPGHPHTGVICDNSYGGSCYVIYTHSHTDDVPELCHRHVLNKSYTAFPCPDCPWSAPSIWPTRRS